jgi:hypothetical protein
MTGNMWVALAILGAWVLYSVWDYRRKERARRQRWDAAKDDRVRPAHKVLGTCPYTFGKGDCTYEETYPFGKDGPVGFFPTVNNPGLTPEQIEVFKREVTERLARAAYAERDEFRKEIIRQLFRKTGDMRAVLSILDSADYPTNFIEQTLKEDGVDPLTLGPIPMKRLKGEEREMPDAWPPEKVK